VRIYLLNFGFSQNAGEDSFLGKIQIQFFMVNHL